MKTMGRKPKPKKTATGRRLLAIREKLGLTQKEAAVKVCVTLNAWHAWENGASAPSKAHLKLLDFLEKGLL